MKYLIILALLLSSCSKEEVKPKADSTIYYRLKIFNKDGSIEYSPVIAYQ